eukprot:maker-scaffold81_size397536-snap-gene-1.13 protein:Tk08528 transcript:maker-scaffold81_size397536-snap-gene-1.13-mRNA-1 annotation:"PREDICTED: pro-resilin-like"
MIPEGSLSFLCSLPVTFLRLFRTSSSRCSSSEVILEPSKCWECFFFFSRRFRSFSSFSTASAAEADLSFFMKLNMGFLAQKQLFFSTHLLITAQSGCFPKYLKATEIPNQFQTISTVRTMRAHIILAFVCFQMTLRSLEVTGMPQPQAQEENQEPMPYEFQWEVKDQESEPDGAFFTHKESKQEGSPDRTEGEYRTWLPDGRLMIVSYYVDGESGFVPTITYEDGHEVKDQPSEPDGALFTDQESKQEGSPDRTEDEYRNWLPNGRLMIVSSYVDGESSIFFLPHTVGVFLPFIDGPMVQEELFRTLCVYFIHHHHRHHRIQVPREQWGGYFFSSSSCAQGAPSVQELLNATRTSAFPGISSGCWHSSIRVSVVDKSPLKIWLSGEQSSEME